MMEAAVCEVQLMIALPFVDTSGTDEAAKKFAGWLKVMVPDTGKEPPALGANTNTAVIFVLLLWRSKVAMLNDLNATRSPTCPLDIFWVFVEWSCKNNQKLSFSCATPLLLLTWEVRTEIPVALPLVMAPITMPLRVMQNDSLPLMTPPPASAISTSPSLTYVALERVIVCDRYIGFGDNTKNARG
jgi:hypothetical protein